MKKSISVANNTYQVEYPDKCPLCHHHGEVKQISTFNEPNNTGVQIVFQCPFSGCKSYFIGYYGPIRESTLLALKPQKPNLTSFPDTIQTLSPSFISIYKEADEALHLGLSQIAGPGFRKGAWVPKSI